jgi:hypothetical protein
MRPERADIPLSPHSEMKCVCTRPLVLRPQMKNVPARTQNARVRAASARTANGPQKLSGTAGADRTDAAASALSPNERRPRSFG